MRWCALFALVFVPGGSRTSANPVEESRLAVLSCQPGPSARSRICQVTGTRETHWYRARGQTAAIRAINGVTPVLRPIDQLTGTLGLSPWLNPGGRNEIEIETGAELLVESHRRVFVASLTEHRPPSPGHLSVWVENTLSNAANVEVRLAGQRRALYVPPESYEVAEFRIPAVAGPVPIELTKFAEALEEGYEVRQWFFRTASGIWNPLQAP